MNKVLYKKGITLIEVLLYISIASILLVTISGFIFMLLDARIKNQTISEVYTQGAFISENIVRVIRSAEAITSPITGASAASATIDVISGGLDPTIFSETGGIFYIQEGGGSQEALTGNRVVVSDVLFRNLSTADSPGSIEFSFVVTHINPENRNQFDFTKIFKGSASIR